MACFALSVTIVAADGVRRAVERVAIQVAATPRVLRTAAVYLAWGGP